MRCCGCGAEFPQAEGPTHAYMLSSPGCWAAYGEVLAREYQDPAYFHLHRLTVDTYAVQHPGLDVPQARNSVGIHLSRLSLILERGWPIERANGAMPAITAKKKHYPCLAPPDPRGNLTVKQLLAASGPLAHESAVTEWAQSVWQAWAEHHATVRAWIDGIE